MKTKFLFVASHALMLMFISTSIYAADQEQLQSQTQKQMQAKKQLQAKTDKDTIYGWELMSVKERNEHRAKMRSLKTQEERTAYLEQHHKKMQQRAKEKGVTLPDRPMRSGLGAGPGPGAGPGAGAGRGAGGGGGGGGGPKR